MNDIKRPFTAIMGGSKVSSKIEIIENLLNKVDNLIIAGGMTYTFTKAMGGKIGISICEDDKLDLALDLIKKAKEKGVNLVLAVDAKIADAFSNDANTQFCAVDEIPDGWEGLDIGPKTEEIFANVIKESKTILWNGPTGVFEFENFTHGSRAVGEAIVEATKNGAFSLVGGGDSVACVNKFGLASGVSYVSTGGGALLEAIEGKVSPLLMNNDLVLLSVTRAVLCEKSCPYLYLIHPFRHEESGTHILYPPFLPLFLPKKKRRKCLFAFNGIATTHAGNTSDAGRTSLSHSQSTRNLRLFGLGYNHSSFQFRQ